MANLNIPKKLKNKYLKTYIDVGNRLISNNKYYAAILAESIIKRPEKNSDLDIVVITNQNCWQRKQLSINGVFIELFFYSEKELMKSFKEKEYQDMHMVAYGFTMFDKIGCLNKLKKIAHNKYKKGPGLINEEKITYLKYLIWDQHQDVMDILCRDKKNAVALMHKSLWQSLELYFNLRNRWFCKPKKLLPSTRKLNRKLYLLLRRFYSLDSKRVDILYGIYRKIISIIIKPIDIDKNFEWNGKKHSGKF
jgi:hypothetical protein